MDGPEVRRTVTPGFIEDIRRTFAEGMKEIGDLKMSEETFLKVNAAAISGKDLAWKWKNLYNAKEKKMVVTAWCLSVSALIGELVGFRHEWARGETLPQKVWGLIHGE